MSLSALIRRLPIDPYLLLLIATVGTALVMPARGLAAPIVDHGVYGAVGLLFFLYGARLSPRAIGAGIAHWRLQSLVFAASFVFFPVVGLLVTLIAKPFLTHDLLVGLLFVCVLPSTVQSSIAFTSIARGNVPAALCSASLSNLLGIVVTPVLVSLLFGSAGVGISGRALGNIAMQILLPFALGQLVRPLIGDWLGRHTLLTSIIDRGSILLVVYAAFSEGVVAGVWSHLTLVSLMLVLFLNLVILAIVILSTTFASRALGFSTEDEISIVFCGSKKSMAGGIPMANILFAGHAVGLIVLPLMLFHQAQLFACAVLARRYRARGKRATLPSQLWLADALARS